MTIDKTADLKPAKDEEPEELDEEGKPLKIKSPTVDKTAVVREKKED